MSINKNTKYSIIYFNKYIEQMSNLTAIANTDSHISVSDYFIKISAFIEARNIYSTHKFEEKSIFISKNIL